MENVGSARSRKLLYALIILLAWLIYAVPVGNQVVSAQAAEGAVHVVKVRGVINPPVADYLQRSLDQAARERASLLVILLDTPGGLENAMRQINQKILASPIPVAVFVHPSGSRAASAGLFILMASHTAVMAPGTNTGAAHPVGINGETDEIASSKAVNDAAATIRALAIERGRNAEWAERAVRESVSITAEEALAMNVIDLIAVDLEDLLQKIDGRIVETSAGELRLNLEGKPVKEFPMTFPEQLLHVISDPNIALILLSIGSIGILAELYNPGALFPGITGVIALLLAFFSLGNLPTNWAGVAFIVLAMTLLIAELNTDGTGILGTGAVVAFLLGALILFRPFTPASPVLPRIGIDPWVIASTTAGMAALVLFLSRQVVRSRNLPVKTGTERFIGQNAVVFRELKPEGRVWFDGQSWYARLNANQTKTAPEGQKVRIIGIERLTLIVEPCIAEEIEEKIRGTEN
jgi:membrane-bound serine protease (ClpP class)